MSDEQAEVQETTSDTLLDNAEPTLGENEYFLAEGIKLITYLTTPDSPL